MSVVWYGANDTGIVRERGQVYNVSRYLQRKELHLQVVHPDIRLKDCLELLAGQLFFRVVPGPHSYTWVVLDDARKNAPIPDAVFIPIGANLVVVYEGLLRHLRSA